MSALLAKVLNSSVGTSTITALDKLLEVVANNAADRVVNSLKSSVKIIASDETLLSYSGEWQSDYSSSTAYYITKNYVKFDCDGVVRVKTVQSGGTINSSPYQYTIKVTDSSGTEVGSSPTVSLSTSANAEIYIDVNVKAGVGYKVSIKKVADSTFPNRNVTFGGRPVLFGVNATT